MNADIRIRLGVRRFMVDRNGSRLSEQCESETKPVDYAENLSILRFITSIQYHALRYSSWILAM